MQYSYVYTTRRREAGGKCFDDLLEAIVFMNAHLQQESDIMTAEILDTLNGNRVVCSRGIKL